MGYRSRKYIGLLYVLPFIIGLSVFQLYPFISSFVYSFTDLSLANDWKFIGLENYIKAFTADKDFYQSLRVTATYVFIAVPCKLLFALFIAMILSMDLKGIKIFRTIYYIPSILGGSIAVSVIWRFLFAYDGLVNQVTEIINIPAINWLGNKDLALPTISMLAVWQFGSSMVLFFVGLKQIPDSLYEAAAIDGATKVAQFFKITLPLLTPTVFFNIIMQTIGAFQEFTTAFVITGGGPMNSTYLYGMMLYENSFTYYKMGYASAQSWILFVVIMLVTGLLFLSSKKWVYYGDGGE
ncbi:MAG: sugar ABC transporter permease [Eubacteriales bacterium]